MYNKRNEEKFLEYQKDGFTISTNPGLLDINMIHDFVSQSYWARGIPKELVIKAIRHSFCFGLYDQGKQVGFARLITDFATEAEICETFVLEPYRGRGLGKWLMECVISCPSLQGIRTLSLGTADAHDFYKQVGFHVVGECPNRMQIIYDRPWYIREKTESV
jgi:N-acetylglutamate synthase-like GNAT family acetyltransferase